MAGLSTRSRRSQITNDDIEIEIIQQQIVKDDSKGKSRNSRISRVSTIPVSPVENSGNTSNELTTTEVESSVTAPLSSEEISSNTSQSEISENSSSEISETSDDANSKKTKDELVRTAHDLDAQLQELIKIYKDEKKLFIDKSIHLLENESHPDWLEKIEELRTKRQDAIKTANERHRLKIESIMAEYDFALKNVSDEFDAAENEIIDEFTTKRKRKTQKEQHRECRELVRSENNVQPNFILESTQIQDDINTINRSIINTSVPKSSTVQSL